MLSVRCKDLVDGKHDTRVALGAQHPGTELAFIGPQQQHGVVELARGRERPPLVAGGGDRFWMVGPRHGRRAQSEDRIACGAIENDIEVRVMKTACVDSAS